MLLCSISIPVWRDAPVLERKAIGFSAAALAGEVAGANVYGNVYKPILTRQKDNMAQQGALQSDMRTLQRDSAVLRKAEGVLRQEGTQVPKSVTELLHSNTSTIRADLTQTASLQREFPQTPVSLGAFEWGSAGVVVLLAAAKIVWNNYQFNRRMKKADSQV